jgi:hypothetical protein
MDALLRRALILKVGHIVLLFTISLETSSKKEDENQLPAQRRKINLRMNGL